MTILKHKGKNICQILNENSQVFYSWFDCKATWYSPQMYIFGSGQQTSNVGHSHLSEDRLLIWIDDFFPQIINETFVQILKRRTIWMHLVWFNVCCAEIQKCRVLGKSWSRSLKRKWLRGKLDVPCHVKMAGLQTHWCWKRAKAYAWIPTTNHDWLESQTTRLHKTWSKFASGREILSRLHEGLDPTHAHWKSCAPHESCRCRIGRTARGPRRKLAEWRAQTHSTAPCKPPSLLPNLILLKDKIWRLPSFLGPFLFFTISLYFAAFEKGANRVSGLTRPLVAFGWNSQPPTACRQWSMANELTFG